MVKINVKKVTDGDTIQSTRGGFYRLANVDAPEKRERGYQKAKETLKGFVEGEKLVAKVEGTSYGRKVATLRIPGEKTTINEKMRRKGYK